MKYSWFKNIQDFTDLHILQILQMRYHWFSLSLQTTAFTTFQLLKCAYCGARSQWKSWLVVASLFDDPWVPVANNWTLSCDSAVLHQLLQLASAHNPLSLMDQYVFEHGAFYSINRVACNVNSISKSMIRQETIYSRIMHLLLYYLRGFSLGELNTTL